MSKFCQVGGRWNQNGTASIRYRSGSCLSAVISIQKSGKTAMTRNGVKPR